MTRTPKTIPSLVEETFKFGANLKKPKQRKMTHGRIPTLMDEVAVNPRRRR